MVGSLLSNSLGQSWNSPEKHRWAQPWAASVHICKRHVIFFWKGSMRIGVSAMESLTSDRKKKGGGGGGRTHPSAGKKPTWIYCSAFACGDAVHTIPRGIFLQLMQLSNFYCNWKTIHHRNFMVGLGKSVIYNKWWNSLSLAIWLHMKNVKCKYGCLQSNTIRSLEFGWSCLRPHCSVSNTNATEHHFPFSSMGLPF